MLMAGQASLLSATELRAKCPDGMFLSTENLCQGKTIRLLQLRWTVIFSLLRQMSHLL